MATIAVVDDTDQIRHQTKSILEHGGHLIIDFDDAQGLLDSFGGIKIDLIVTDLEMKTPGEVLVSTLREKGIEIPILIVTGKSECDINYLLGLGAQSVLFKPFTMNELFDEINNCLFV